MPLPADEKLIALSQDLLKQFDAIFGLHPGFRPAHARGVMLTGLQFTPAPDAFTLTRAPHIVRDSDTRYRAVFEFHRVASDSGQRPQRQPAGLAIRFHLAEHVNTDIVSHSTDGFPTKQARSFWSSCGAVASSDPSKPPPSPIEEVSGCHPKALAFARTPKPAPSSFATGVLLRRDSACALPTRRV